MNYPVEPGRKEKIQSLSNMIGLYEINMNELMKKRRQRIEDLLDERLAMIEDNMVNAYYQSRDISNLTQALLNMIRIEKEETD